MIDAAKYGTVTEAARAAGVPVSTLSRAIDRGEVGEPVRTHGGTRLVQIRAAKRWAKNRPEPAIPVGRKS